MEDITKELTNILYDYASIMESIRYSIHPLDENKNLVDAYLSYIKKEHKIKLHINEYRPSNRLQTARQCRLAANFQIAMNQLYTIPVSYIRLVVEKYNVDGDPYLIRKPGKNKKLKHLDAWRLKYRWIDNRELFMEKYRELGDESLISIKDLEDIERKSFALRWGVQA